MGACGQAETVECETPRQPEAEEEGAANAWLKVVILEICRRNRNGRDLIVVAENRALCLVRNDKDDMVWSLSIDSRVAFATLAVTIVQRISIGLGPRETKIGRALAKDEPRSTSNQ